MVSRIPFIKLLPSRSLYLLSTSTMFRISAFSERQMGHGVRETRTRVHNHCCQYTDMIHVGAQWCLALRNNGWNFPVFSFLFLLFLINGSGGGFDSMSVKIVQFPLGRCGTKIFFVID